MMQNQNRIAVFGFAVRYKKRFRFLCEHKAEPFLTLFLHLFQIYAYPLSQAAARTTCAAKKLSVYRQDSAINQNPKLYMATVFHFPDGVLHAHVFRPAGL